jgi:hypothetical protein
VVLKENWKQHSIMNIVKVNMNGFILSINENFRANKIEDVRIQNSSRTPQNADSCAVVHYEAHT